MRNRWLLLVVIAVAGAWGVGNSSSVTQSAAATISTTTATRPTTTARARGSSQPRSRSTASYQVMSGDNLWSISKRHLAVSRERSSKEFGNRKIAAYWLRVIAANAPRLVSGDPDLVYPGEMIVLPPVASATPRPAPEDQTQPGPPAPGPTTTGPTTTGPTTTGPAVGAPSTSSPRPPAYVPSPATSPTNPPAQGGPDEPSSGGGETQPEPPKEMSYSVVAGDNLWTIARDRLAKSRSGGSGKPTNREVANYWLQVIDANRYRLRSGDPDLIYPGETIVLPPFD